MTDKTLSQLDFALGIPGLCKALTFGAKVLVLFCLISASIQESWANTVLDTCPAQSQNIADTFPNISYSQNSGSQNWTGSWIEIGESDGPNAGIARVRNDLCSSENCLRFGVPSGNSAQTYANRGLSRTADLSSAASATLSFVYRNGVNAGEQTVTLSISDNGGSTWTNLQSYFINATNMSPTQASFDISAYAASNTQIRFLASGTNAIIGMYVDDIDITFTPYCQPIPIAHYRFEEENYNGSSDEVLDSSGNQRHGTVLSNTIPETSDPVLASSFGTCGYASQNSGAIQIDGLSLNTTVAGAKTTVAFWMKWNGESFVMPIGWEFYSLFIDNTSFGFNTSNSDIFGISNAGLANGWHHIVAEFTNGDVSNNRLYIDGVEQVLTQRNNSPLNNLAYVDDKIQLGGWSSDTGYRFEGLLDEVYIYDGGLTTAEVQTLMNKRHNCPVTPSLVAEYRFDELQYDGTSGEVEDSSTSSLNGQSAGGLLTQNAQICSGGTFDGIDDHIVLPPNAIDFSGGFAAMAWVDFDAVGKWERIFDFGNAASRNNIAFGRTNTSNDLRLDIYDGATRCGTANADNIILPGRHHYAVTISADRNVTFYRDGVSKHSQTIACLPPSATRSLNYIGRSNWQDDDYFSHQIDELKIYNSGLSTQFVEQAFINESAGKNADGSERVCPIPPPIAEYRFNELSWGDATADVIDSASGLHGVADRAQPVPGLICNAADFDSTNVITVANNSLLEVGSNNEDYTVNFWLKPRSISPDWVALIHKGDNNSDRTFSARFEGSRTTISNRMSTDSGQVVSNTPNGISLDAWSMISLVKAGNDLKTYYNGILEVSTAFTGSSISNTGALHIGDSPFYGGLDGLMDELVIYRSALSEAQLGAIHTNNIAGKGWDGQVQVCPVPDVHHYEIVHDGQGLTCEAETITIRSCLDASCSVLNAEPVSLDFLVDGNVVSSPTFTGTTSINVRNTDAETVSFSLANTSMASPNPLVCNNGVSNSCSMAFTNAGFRFLYNSGDTVAKQTAGVAFTETLQLQAVKDTNGVCTGLFTGSTNVQLSQENVNPGGVGGLNFATGASAVAKHPSATSITLSFGANSIATVPTPFYHDAGQIRLHANYAEGGVALSGSSNPFWVAPAFLEINAQVGGVDINGASAISTVSHGAGEDFGLSITAFNAASPRAITQNYVPGQMQFKVTRTAPTLAGSADGSFRYAFSGAINSSASAAFEDVTLSTFIAGMYGFNGARYSEVGLLNLDVQDLNYGNENIVVSAVDINIGRFTPYYFTQSVAQQGGLLATCGVNVSVNAFSGQRDENNASAGAIAYSIPPVFAITAYNKQGLVTQNYYEDSNGSANDFMRLNVENINVVAPTADHAATGVDGTLLPVVANMNAGVLSQSDQSALPSIVALPRGTVHYALSNNDNFVYTRSTNAKVSPFSAQVEFNVASIIDADSVSASSMANVLLTGVDIHFGRMRLENSFGSETENLAQHLTLEHYSGSDFVTSTNNSCVSFNADSMSLISIDLNSDLSGVNNASGHFVNGQTKSIELASPGLGNQGAIGVSYNTYQWLKYDWNNTGTLSENPKATATFGLFRGDDRMRNWREVFE